MSDLETQDILGVRVVSATATAVQEVVAQRYATGCVQNIAFLNSNLLVTAGAEASALLSQFTVLNDGLAVDVAAWMLNGTRFRDNLNGTDLTPRLLRRLPVGAKVFLYGARPDAVARAADLLAREGIAVCGFRDGYCCPGADAAEAARRAEADVVLVALGNPRQERWIVEHGPASGARLFVAVGALFDYWSGAAARAPLLFRILRLEWLFRVLREPDRLGRRYTIEMARFFRIVLAERRRRRPGARRLAP